MNLILETLWGPMMLNRFSPIGRAMMHYGEHGTNEIEVLRNVISEGSVVLDVGAHQGTHALPFAKIVGSTGAVHAFEPQRVMMQNILASAALNGMTNIHANNMAVGESSGKVRIKQFDYRKRGHFSGMSISDANMGEEVPLVTIDGYCADHGITNLALIKIDVEGMETSVLKGAAQAIRTMLPVIYMEHHAASGNQKVVWLRDLGYSVFEHAPRGYNPKNFYGYGIDTFQGGQDHNVLAIPADKLERFAGTVAALKPLPI